jgi:FkbM family methyltransferase
MKIYDCFPYFNEKELLELRIKLLYNKVDKFIITDANKTHRGTQKEFTCKKTLLDLGLYDEKIEVIELDLPDYNEEKNAWVRERMQRNAAAKFIVDGVLAIISDCDEIINPEFVDYYASISTKHPNNILRIPLVNLNARADLRAYDNYNNPIKSHSSFFCQAHHLKKYTLSDIRESASMYKNFVEFTDIFITEDGVIKEAGWHFGWMGGSARHRIKASSFLHWDEVELVKNYIPKENENDLLGRSAIVLKKYPIENLPSLIFQNEHLKNFLLPPKKIKIVQIGANDGDDDLNKHIKKANIEFEIAIFVEPNSIFNEKIKKSYAGYDNFYIENVAVVPEGYSSDDKITMYYHTGDIPRGTTSIKLSHILNHKEYYTEGKIKTFQVNYTSLSKLLNKYNIKNLDWLLIDVEGLDADVLLDFDWKMYDIKRIEFEYIHLGDRAEEIKQLFLSMNYTRVDAIGELDWAFEK